MKRLLYLMLLATVGLTSCELETSDNGDLDGMWLLTTVDTLSTGGSSEVRDQQITWAFQVNAMYLRQPPYFVLFHFQHQGNQLILKDAVFDDRMSGDIPITDENVINGIGLSQLPDTFTINRLSGSSMDIANRQYRYYFRKY